MTFRQLAQRIRVPAGFVLLPLLFIASNPTRTSLAAGAIIAVLGLAIRAWASGYLKKNMELTTTGPYAYTRNPLYLGTLLLGTGVAISTGAAWFIAVFMALYLLIYVPVMLAEAETVGKLFPNEYAHYSSNVPLLVPRLTPYRAPAAISNNNARAHIEESHQERRFDLSLYLRHREYRAAIGVAIVFLLQAAKFLAFR